MGLLIVLIISYRRDSIARHFLGVCGDRVNWPSVCDLLCARDTGKDAGGYRAHDEWTSATNELGGQHEAAVVQYVKGGGSRGGGGSGKRQQTLWFTIDYVYL